MSVRNDNVILLDVPAAGQTPQRADVSSARMSAEELKRKRLIGGIVSDGAKALFLSYAYPIVLVVQMEEVVGDRLLVIVGLHGSGDSGEVHQTIRRRRRSLAAGNLAHFYLPFPIKRRAGHPEPNK